MLLGVLPTEALLRQYRLTEYADFATGLRTGNVALLLKALETHQVLLVQVRPAGGGGRGARSRGGCTTLTPAVARVCRVFSLKTLSSCCSSS
jgi:hypothetical protein